MEPEEDPQKTGVKIVRVSPDESFIASGDRNGNIRIHDARSYEEICKIEAHDAEVTSLKFAGDRYLASASRDRLVRARRLLNEMYTFQLCSGSSF